MRSGFLAVLGFFALAWPLLGQGVAPSVTSNPTDVAAYVNGSVTLTAVVDGTAPISFQWRKSPLGSGPVAIAGATSASLTLSVLTLADTAYYDVVATNAFGSVTTAPALLSVTKRPQTLTFTLPSTAAAGSGLTLAATASSGLPATYSLVSGAAALSGNVLTGAGGSVVVRANQAGDSVYAAADPVDRTIAFVAGAISPFIVSPPIDQTVTAGVTVTFRANAVGTPMPTYQWFRDGVALPGATDVALVLANTTLGSSGSYSVTATNFVGVATAAATLTVRQAPIFTTVPASQTVAAGTNVIFTADVTGFPRPTLQWRKNGVAIAGATNNAHRIASPSAIDAARYDVVATNALGTVTSPAATLTVTTRDFTGTYFGQFTSGPTAAPASGDFALLVRANRSATFLANLPGVPLGIIANVNVDVGGSIAQTVITTTARPVTLRLTIDDNTGVLSGTLAELGIALQGTQAARTGSSSAVAGLYSLAVIGTAAATGNLLVAPDGQTLLVIASGTTVDSGRAAIGSNGRLALTTTSGAALDLGFAASAISGTLRSGNAVTNLGGALETAARTERMANLSVRSPTANATPLITGFVVNGTTPKQLLIRAAGPALAQAPFNVAGALGNPTLQVFRGTNVVAQNDDWNTPAANGVAVTAAATRAGAFPFRAGSNDAALVTTLAPGAYTALIAGGNGTVLAEVYEVLETSEPPGTRRLVNISARGVVAPGAPLIAGFVIAGTAPQRVLVRGIGPSLAAPPFNVAGPLANPQLTIFSGTTAVRTNDDWFRDADATLIRDAAVRAGAFPLGAQSADAALLVYLQPGAYTAQVNGPTNASANQGTGIALVEVYEATP